MEYQLETFEEHREVLEKARDAIFTRKQKSEDLMGQIRDGLSGETNQIGEFIDEFNRSGRGRNASVELGNVTDAQQSSDEELFSNKQDNDNDEESKGNLESLGPNGFPQ